MIDCNKCKRDPICHTPDKHTGGCHSYEEANPDVVRVVRCKDCKYWNIREGNDLNKKYFCAVDDMWCKPARAADDFCSYGERKNNEN